MSRLPNRNRRSAALMAILALSAVAVAADGPRVLLDAPPSAPHAAPVAAPGGYMLRCWQYGRLLFEEADVQLPADFHAALTLRGSDPRRAPVYVSDTGSAVCLIRRTAAPRR